MNGLTIKGYQSHHSPKGIYILCPEVTSLLLYSMFRGVVTTFISEMRLYSPEVQLQASKHNYKGIIYIPCCKIKWFDLYSVIPIQS